MLSLHCRQLSTADEHRGESGAESAAALCSKCSDARRHTEPAAAQSGVQAAGAAGAAWVSDS